QRRGGPRLVRGDLRHPAAAGVAGVQRVPAAACAVSNGQLERRRPQLPHRLRRHQCPFQPEAAAAVTHKPASDRSDEGFTLVELLVTITPLGVITTAVMTVIITVQRTQLFQMDTTVSMDETRQALDRMRTEVRASRRVLTTSTASQLHVWIDSDQD